MRVARGGEVGFAGSGSGLSRTRARATLQVFAPRSRTRGKCRLISCRQNSVTISPPPRRTNERTTDVTYQQSLAEPNGHLVLEIVSLSARFDIGGGLLLLQPFRLAVEDFEDGGSGGLERVATASPSCSPGDGGDASSV